MLGIYEALELRDNDKAKYHGKGVLKAVDHINKVSAPELVKANVDVVEQEKIDEIMLKLDGTENKSKFGANAILGVSMAVCKVKKAVHKCISNTKVHNANQAGAAHKGVPLYKHIADLAGVKNVIMPCPAFNGKF